MSLPGSKVRFIHRNRPVETVVLRARRKPFLVSPLVSIDCAYYRAGPGTQLGIEGKGIRFLHGIVVELGLYIKLVFLTLPQARNEKLPDSATRPPPHRVATAIPAVEVAHHAHSARIRRPHGKRDTRSAANFGEVGSELFVSFQVGSFGEKVQIKVRQDGPERIGIFKFVDVSGSVSDLQTITKQLATARKQRLKDPLRSDPGHGLILGEVHRRDARALRLRQERAYGDRALTLQCYQ